MNNYSLLYSVPKYVFVTSDNLTCNTKTLNYRNNYMVNISCDIPCIVETLYSCIKYDTKEDWLTYGESSGIQCFNNEKNIQGTYNLIKDYYYPDTSKAVYGDYYVVAAHFADGTTQITEVKQK